jgi:FKBP-type peptidyl-prolyl cis-trans isomerase FklB
MNQTLKAYSKTLQAKRQAKMMEAGIKNKSEGLAFLATNKNNPGVITLTNGLQYQVLKDGNGPIPTATSTVTVIYRGTFIDGTEFDSSAKEGKPNGMDMQVTRVIPGWTQALEMMKTGSKWRLFVPSDLAYGPRGQRDIEPNKTLIFDIELLAVQAPHPAPIAPPQNAPLTSDIIKVPSADELKKGAKIEVIKPEDVQKAQAQAQGQTNAPPQ